MFVVDNMTYSLTEYMFVVDNMTYYISYRWHVVTRDKLLKLNEKIIGVILEWIPMLITGNNKSDRKCFCDYFLFWRIYKQVICQKYSEM
jgi:hypothetical protein